MKLSDLSILHQQTRQDKSYLFINTLCSLNLQVALPMYDEGSDTHHIAVLVSLSRHCLRLKSNFSAFKNSQLNFGPQSNNICKITNNMEYCKLHLFLAAIEESTYMYISSFVCLELPIIINLVRIFKQSSIKTVFNWSAKGFVERYSSIAMCKLIEKRQSDMYTNSYFM